MQPMNGTLEDFDDDDGDEAGRCTKESAESCGSTKRSQATAG
jgi:hypothetical protein